MRFNPFESMYIQAPVEWGKLAMWLKRRSKRTRMRMKQNQTLRRVYVVEKMRVYVPQMPSWCIQIAPSYDRRIK